MENGAIGEAVQSVSSPGSGDCHVMAAASELRTGTSVHTGCEAVHATERAASKTAVCRACWTYLCHPSAAQVRRLCTRNVCMPRWAHGPSAIGCRISSGVIMRRDAVRIHYLQSNGES
jgi:hypothetical protein